MWWSLGQIYGYITQSVPQSTPHTFSDLQKTIPSKHPILEPSILSTKQVTMQSISKDSCPQLLYKVIGHNIICSANHDLAIMFYGNNIGLH